MVKFIRKGIFFQWIESRVSLESMRMTIGFTPVFIEVEGAWS
jgi:hypothetical protein